MTCTAASTYSYLHNLLLHPYSKHLAIITSTQSTDAVVTTSSTMTCTAASTATTFTSLVLQCWQQLQISLVRV